MTRTLWLALAFALVLLATSSAHSAERPPNFLFILGDNLGKDWFGCYGGDGNHTPQVDKLAAGGVKFSTCYTTALCSTTRVQLYTGRYPFHTGWHTHHDAAIYGGGGFDWRRETTFMRVLQSAGYATAIAGKWQINDLYDQTDALEQHGFDEHLVWTGALAGEGLAEARWQASLKTGDESHRAFESRYWDPVIFRNGQRDEIKGRFGPDVYADYLVDFMSRNRERPFLAYYSCPLTHVPPVPTPHSLDKSASEQEQYVGMVEYIDYQVGHLIAELERLGLRENTIVIFTTDNGSSKRFTNTVGGKKAPGGLGTLSEGGLDVPLVVNCPGEVAKGRVSDALVDCSDFFPTLAELAGAKIPSGLVIDGKSFAGQLGENASTSQQRDWIFTQYANVRVVRDHRYKLYSTGEQYDIVADQEETKNLAGSDDKEAEASRRRLQAVLDSLPPTAELPFKARSSSAFNMEKGKRSPKGKN
jgi:arylsulfatase A-like enzyme